MRNYPAYTACLVLLTVPLLLAEANQKSGEKVPVRNTAQKSADKAPEQAPAQKAAEPVPVQSPAPKTAGKTPVQVSPTVPQKAAPPADQAATTEKPVTPVYSNEIVRSHVLLGLTQVKAGDYPAGVAAFEKALKIDPKVTFHRDEMACVYCDLGIVYIMNNDLFGSLPYFERSLSLNQEQVRSKDALAAAYSLIAEEFIVMQKADSAKKYFNLALEIYPDIQFEKVLKCFDEPMCNIEGLDAMNQDLAMIYCAVARQYFKEKKYDMAREYYERAIRLRPNLNRARKGLAEVGDVE